MKKFAVLAILILLCAPSFAISLGGPGVNKVDRHTGTYEVIGTLLVNGYTKLNDQLYVWPKTQVDGTTVLSNTIVKGKGMLAWVSPATPSGANGAVQFNNAGTFAGDDGLAYDPAKKNLMINGKEASVAGHGHAASDITAGVISPANGGTGSSDGSIAALGELKLSAGGTNQNVMISPTGTGHTHVNGALMATGAVIGSGFNVAGTDGTSSSINVITDVRMGTAGTLQKKIKTLTIAGGIVTAVSAESDWMDVR